MLTKGSLTQFPELAPYLRSYGLLPGEYFNLDYICFSVKYEGRLQLLMVPVETEYTNH